MPKRRTLVCVTLAVVAIVVGALVSIKRAPLFTAEQFDQIHEGMTLAEVEAVLGCGPGNYTQSKYNELMLLLNDPGIDPTTGEFSQGWVADTPEPPYTGADGRSHLSAAAIRVRLGADRRVVGINRQNTIYTLPTLLDRLRAWVGW